MTKLAIFIDGTWLYMNTPRLAESYRSPNYQIDFGKLPRVLVEELRERMPFPVDLDLVRTHLFGSYAANQDPRDQESVDRRLNFFRRLADEYGYEVETFPINFRGRRLRRIDREPDDTFEPKEKCVDIALATTMAHFAATPGSYDIAIAVLGDGDFMPMLTHVRRLGKRVAIVSIKDSCAEDYVNQSEGSRCRDFDIIWLDDILEKLELKFERVRRECEDPAHHGDRLVWTDYRPRRGESFYCDDCRARRARERQNVILHDPPASVPPTAAPGATNASLPANGGRRTGVISKLKADKGYGFIRVPTGQSYFFHATSVRGAIEFVALAEGMEASFEAETEPTPEENGRAVNVEGVRRAFPSGFASTVGRERK